MRATIGSSRVFRGLTLCGVVVVLAALGPQPCGRAQARMGPQELHSAFEVAYSDWRRSLSADGPSPRSDDAAYIDNAPFAAMVALGPRAAPLMVQKLRTDPEAHFLVHALWRVTRKQFPPAADGRPRGNQGLAQLWVQWAAGGYRSTSTEFSAALAQWRSGRTKGQVALWTEITRIHEGIGL